LVHIKLQAMPEQFLATPLAAKQAGELAAQQLRDALAGKPTGKDGIVAASNTLREITGSKGRRVPDQLEEDKTARAAVANGVLLVSNDNTPSDATTCPDPLRGNGFADLAKLNHDPESKIAPGTNSAPGSDARRSKPVVQQ
jgi:hypothetical protein